MRVKSCAMVLFVLALVVPAAVLAEENVDLQMAMRIRDEAFSNSKVMETAGYLSNVIGPRLTGSPSLERAHQWVKLQLEGLGLENVRLESWGPFGQGWSFDHVSVHMLTPDASLLIAYPRAWTPGTNGVVRGKVMPVVIATEGDFEKYRGKLAGRILLMEPARDLKVHDKADFSRYSDQQLEEMKQFPMPAAQQQDAQKQRETYLKQQKFLRALNQFLMDERVLAVIAPALSDGGMVMNLRGATCKKGGIFPVPAL